MGHGFSVLFSNDVNVYLQNALSTILNRYFRIRFPHKSDFLHTPELTEQFTYYDDVDLDYTICSQPCQSDQYGPFRDGTITRNTTKMTRSFRIYWLTNFCDSLDCL